MSAKFMYSLSDENSDLQKQIGCMNGLFQLFDCHHFLGSRRIASSNQKRLPPGQNGKHGTEPKIASEKIQENNLKKTVREKQRFSFESPRTSFSSSSCSSSSSSADCSKTSQVERSSLSQTTFSETPRLEISNYRSDTSLQSSQESVDLRNVVKDSIYREPRGLSIKTASRVEAGRHQSTMKYIDSPRPSPKTAKTKKTSSLNESSCALPKLQELPRMSNERKDSALSFAPRDAPRFSYHGRGSQDALKIKLKDLPRLSLDSRRESSINGSINSPKPNFLPEELQRSSMNSNDMKRQHQEPGSYRGPSSVVAKLMGLEESLDFMLSGNQRGQTGTGQSFKDDPLSTSSRIDEKKQNWISGFPRNLKMEPNSSRLTNVDSKKPVATRYPIEPAPWKQLNGNRGQASAPKCREVPIKVPTNSSLTVYGEIEKRLAELEFKKSGKDLRALKQILEAMQKSKEMFENRKEEQALNFISHTNITVGQSSDTADLRKLQSSGAVSVSIKGTSSPTSLKSPIKIIRPAKFMEKASNSTSSVVATGSLRRLKISNPTDTRNEKVDKRPYKDLTPRASLSASNRFYLRDDNNARNTRFNRTSKGPSPTAREYPKLAMGSETTCLKLQKKKHEFEKQSHRTGPTSDQSRSRKQSGRLQAEAGLQHRKLRHKSHKLQPNDDQLSDMSSDIRDLSHQGDTNSMQSDSNMSAASYGDTEVTSTDRSCKLEGTLYHGKKQNDQAARFAEGDSTSEPRRTTLEQPSPISVLDATFYGDESPSPVKKKSNAFKDDERLIPGEADWSLIGLNHLSSCRGNHFRSKTEYSKAENIQHLVPKLKNLDSIREEFIINEISPIYHSPNPDHKYILEIFLASGLLTELESGCMAHQLHQSGHLINPNLFPALEQTKASIRLLNGNHSGRKTYQLEPIEKNHRKLIFDAVNEVAIRKLAKDSSYKQWFLQTMHEDRRPRRQQLVRDLCSEIDNLQTASKISLDDEDDSLRSFLWGDLTLESVDWTECRSEIPWVVLDVERLIFKDLICEFISGEVANPQGQPGRHCRRLVLK